MESIVSIRKHLPDSFVVLIDNSNVSRELGSLVDLMVSDVTNETLRRATDEAEAKQLGEAMLLLQGLEALKQQQVMFKHLFKLTGRYVLNDDFNYSTYRNSMNVFKLAKLGRSVSLHKDFYAYTCFFKIDWEHVESFRAALSRIVGDLSHMLESNIPTMLHDDVESRLSLMLPNVKYVQVLGVTQRVSTWETEDKDI